MTNKIETPADLPDTVLIQYKEPKTSSESLATVIKTAVLEPLKDLGITGDSIVAMDRESAMIKTTQEKAARVKAIVDTHITHAQGATITVI